MTALYGLFAIHLHPNGKATQCRYGWRIPQCSLKNRLIPIDSSNYATALAI